MGLRNGTSDSTSVRTLIRSKSSFDLILFGIFGPYNKIIHAKMQVKN
jgi:hypothetical protein